MSTGTGMSTGSTAVAYDDARGGADDGALTAAHVARARAALAALDDWARLDPERLSATAKTELLRDIEAAEAKVAAIRLRLIGVAQDAADAGGHRDVAAWHAHVTRTDTGAARAMQRTAAGLRTAPEVARALRRGTLGARAAAVIVDTLGELPEVGEDVRHAAAALLVAHARHLTPRQLAVRGKGVLDELGATRDQLGKTLAEQEARARARACLTFQDRRDGTTSITGSVPTVVASRIRTVLHAYTSPRAVRRDGGTVRPAAEISATGTGTATAGSGLVEPPARPSSYANRLGQALCTVFEQLDPAQLPRHGGTATTVVVTIDHEQLTERLGTASLLDGLGVGSSETLGSGTPISAGEARRLACNAGIVPAVLGGRSQVLDLGRRARLFTPAQVTALRLRDQSCRAEGCTIPGAWCEAHHLDPWSRGGPTDLSNGVLLCSHHHHLVHAHTHTHHREPDGTIRFELAPAPVARAA